MKNRLLGFVEAVSFGAAYLLSNVLSSLLFSLIALGWTVVEFASNRMSIQSDVFDERVSEIMSSELIVAVLISNLLVVFFVWLILWCRKQTMREYVGFRPVSTGRAVSAIVAGLSLNVAVGCVLEQISLPAEMIQEYASEMEAILGGSFLVVLLTAAIVAPFVEELIFRGALLRAFQKVAGTPVAVLAVSLLFALVHVGPIQRTYAFVIGAILCVVRLASGSLWCTIFMHIAFNAANYLVLEESLYGNPVFLAGVSVLFVVSCAVACMRKKHP